MKFIVMLIVLFLLTDPVLANQNQKNAECLAMYRNTLRDTNQHPSQILNFLEMCAPANAVNNLQNSSERQHQKLLQVIDVDKRVTTIKV